MVEAAGDDVLLKASELLAELRRALFQLGNLSPVKEWFVTFLRSQTQVPKKESEERQADLERQITVLINQQDHLLNLRLHEEIEADTLASNQTELRDRLASLKLQLDVHDRSHDETADLAVKVFELSQTIREKWLTADYETKRRILEIICLNCRLEGATLFCQKRKPFDALAEGLILKNSRADWIRTSDLLVPNQAL